MQITNNANLLLNEMNLKEAVPVVRHGNEVMFSEKAKNDEYKVNKINEGFIYALESYISKKQKGAYGYIDIIFKVNLYDDTLHMFKKMKEYLYKNWHIDNCKLERVTDKEDMIWYY